MRRALTAAMVAVLSVVGFAGAPAQQQSAGTPAEAPVSDRQLGLAKVRLTEDRAPARFNYSEQGPGESQRLSRPFEGAPPLIPHSLDGLVPVTREENMCVACHATGEAVPGGPPHAPPSHFIDWRNAPGVARTEIAGSRWVCTSCHVPQSDAPLLVENPPVPR